MAPESAAGAALAPGMRPGLTDWSRPWLAPYRQLGQRVLDRLRRGCSVAQALNAEHAPAAPRFVPQHDLPAGMGYEDFVHREGAVPTRDHWHDFFNGLVWLQQPALKWQLNRLHVQALAAGEGGAGRRGPLRDALTLLDESGALLQAPEALIQALAARDWAALFGPLRPLWAQAHLQIVGHALLEQLMHPRKPLCAHVLHMPDWPRMALADTRLPSAELLRAKPFLPLPVLGVPGWWPANEVADFYADVQVFRPPRAPALGRGGR